MLTHDMVGKHAVATCAEMRLERGDVWVGPRLWSFFV